MIIEHDVCDSMVLLKWLMRSTALFISAETLKKRHFKALLKHISAAFSRDQAQNLLAANATCLFAFVTKSLMPAPPFYLAV